MALPFKPPTLASPLSLPALKYTLSHTPQSNFSVLGAYCDWVTPTLQALTYPSPSLILPTMSCALVLCKPTYANQLPPPTHASITCPTNRRKNRYHRIFRRYRISVLSSTQSYPLQQRKVKQAHQTYTLHHFLCHPSDRVLKSTLDQGLLSNHTNLTSSDADLMTRFMDSVFPALKPISSTMTSMLPVPPFHPPISGSASSSTSSA